MNEDIGAGRTGRGKLTERRNSPYTNNTTTSGKIPPQARDLEEAVIGALMLEKDALSTVIDILKPESFYVDAHQVIFKAIQELFTASSPIDILTVTNQLRQTAELEKVGGAYYVTELTNRVASAANIEFHARIIAQKFIQRELIRISTEIISNAYEDTTDVFDLLDKAEKNLFAIAEGNLRRESEGMSTLIRKSIEQIESLKDKADGLTGVPSGFSELDRMTSGWQSSDLVILAARPAMGKTAFVLSLARNAAVIGKRKIAIFSLEMSAVQLTNRLISSEAELSSDKIRRGKLEPHEWQQLLFKVGTLSEAGIFIDDTPALNIFELRAKARRLKAQHGIDMIIIDYLQLMSGTGDKNGNREQEISNISRSLKSIAKELNIPVIALSQLSRAVETRGGNKKPILSDLRESGSIEQDADMVLFIHRPEYYGLDVDDDGNSTKGMAEIIIAKHRNGAVGSVRLKYIGDYVKFADLDAYDYGGRTQNPLGPSDDFSSNATFIIKPSRMNEPGDDVPPF
jgi:replicative DNA helicase